MAETRKRGPIKCRPGSKEAKRIEGTHGFNRSLETRKKWDDDPDQAPKSSNKSAVAKGDKS